MSAPKKVNQACSFSDEGQPLKENDDLSTILTMISEMLMEEPDLEYRPCMLDDCLFLQATEKSLYQVLHNNPHHDPNSSTTNSAYGHQAFPAGDDYANQSNENENLPGKELDIHLAGEQKSNYASEGELLEMYDDVMLAAANRNRGRKKPQAVGHSLDRPKRGRPRVGPAKAETFTITNEYVDLQALLHQCAQGVVTSDTKIVDSTMRLIRQHSSPKGDSLQRLAFYIANALEARMAGMGPTTYAVLNSKRLSAAEALKGYAAYAAVCPFVSMSVAFANRTIAKLVAGRGATRLHIIDFGILYGFQWPSLIEALSRMPGGPPTLRVTGIDFPQPGLYEAERVEATGRRLARYCEKFGVPFEYKAIVCKWETVRAEDLEIEKSDIVVVNSLYRLHNVPDETVELNSPRDCVLRLIRSINPNLFLLGVMNASFNGPYFFERFKEALIFYRHFFDMLEAVLARDDENRMQFEKMGGKDAINVIACEGRERIERPETYRQWQFRCLRGGLRQVGVDEEIVEYVKRKVRMEYDKHFFVDEEDKWMLMGWRGRPFYVISCWQPAYN